MGIESDQLVYDYLSRVGDLAQQQQLSSAARMRLVSTLRGEIDRQRGKQSGDSPAAVRRIIGRLGTPGELVAAAATSGDGTVELPERPERTEAVPEEGRGIPRPRKGMLRKDSSGKGASQARESGSGVPEEPGSGTPEAVGGRVPSPPHMAGTDELGPSGSEPDWWRIEPGPSDAGVDVPGFVGGVEIPDMMRPPPSRGAVPRPRAAGDEEPDEEPDTEEEAEESAPRRRRLPQLRRRAPREDGAGGHGFSHPLLLLAAVLLVAGAVTGSWLALAGGWLLAYSSRTLSRAEAKWAAMGLPGVVAAGALVWLWGRSDGRWGEPIGTGQMGDAIGQMWPWVVRGAAVASALYLVWRSRRPRS
ncbi:hypothetical protein OG978_22790 [Streptomyces sp. NBC_01591]|uniref:hypothetical protein n=1 Tax=Streptomyces sp. NBC_01591 TaxID=2975888 RepID=UPI002DDA05B4|nr:hypothetical protein [Streptomyces sp. NBC_01591]WSD69952.1 hypothetical protein OG978_22790 [Streptomyces sp. NBC_01591]